MLVIRHGDVGIYKIKKNATSMKRNKVGKLTVALGEVTGHHHTITPTKGSSVFSLTETDTQANPMDDKIFFSVEGAPAVITHQEHDPAVLEPLGEDEVYMRVIQNEYQPFEKTIQRVAD